MSNEYKNHIIVKDVLTLVKLDGASCFICKKRQENTCTIYSYIYDPYQWKKEAAGNSKWMQDTLEPEEEPVEIPDKQNPGKSIRVNAIHYGTVFKRIDEEEGLSKHLCYVSETILDAGEKSNSFIKIKLDLGLQHPWGNMFYIGEQWIDERFDLVEQANKRRYNLSNDNFIPNNILRKLR